nr:cytochrome c oxidase assembly protein COX11, mitochondrial [Tanacetum cinerariifolium]
MYVVKRKLDVLNNILSWHLRLTTYHSLEDRVIIKWCNTCASVFFYIDPEFETDPRMDGIDNIILSYTFFKIAEEKL